MVILSVKQFQALGKKQIQALLRAGIAAKVRR